MKHPATRPRRLRQSDSLRKLNSNIELLPSDFVQPLFIVDKNKANQEITNMPDVYRLGEYELLATAEKCMNADIPAIALFPRIDDNLKTINGEESCNPNGLVQRRVQKLKQEFPELEIICDCALDPYTSHGQDGVISEKGSILNDETVTVLCRQALSLAQAGVTAVAPSDMMDGRIKAIRSTLEDSGHTNTIIISYCVKYASHFYSPFRDAVGSQKKLGMADKKTYQMDYTRTDEYQFEMQLDIQEGADILMVKPALPYLDILYQMSRSSPVPVYAFHVSGEYALLKHGHAQGIVDYDSALHESLIAIKRAGARAIFSYAAFSLFNQ